MARLGLDNCRPSGTGTMTPPPSPRGLGVSCDGGLGISWSLMKLRDRAGGLHFCAARRQTRLSLREPSGLKQPVSVFVLVLQSSWRSESRSWGNGRPGGRGEV